MKMSIIIPAHNESLFIEKTIEGLHEQLPAEAEIIVVANGCVDDTAQIANESGAKLLLLEEGNPSLAKNIGAENALGSILVFHDADTGVSDNYLEEIYKAVEGGAEYGCAHQIPETTDYWYRILLYLVNSASTKRRIVHGNCFITKTLFMKTDGFNLTLSKMEDSELSYRLSGLGQFAFLENAWIKPSERRFRDAGYFIGFMKWLHYVLMYKVRNLMSTS